MIAALINGNVMPSRTDCGRMSKDASDHFTTAAADLPTSGGMVCFGGGGGAIPQDPENWSRTDLASYVDCLAYGNYDGPTRVASGNPTPLLPVGHSLERVSDTDDNETDFDCGDPATPENNA